MRTVRVMVWGKPRGVSDLVDRVRADDAGLTSLTILSMRKLGAGGRGGCPLFASRHRVAPTPTQTTQAPPRWARR